MTAPFMGVATSLTGRRWTGPDASADRAALALAQQTELPAPVCAVLARLGVAPSDADRYLNPKLRDLMPDPRSLRDLERAASRLSRAVDKAERIAIFADYDVDGGASAALLLIWLRDLGRDATLYVPDRIDEGYGPNETAMADLAARHDLIVCVDCGTLSHDPIAAARGADVVVIDHHLAAEALPAAHAIVNPNRQDEDGQLAHLCAAGVVFLVLVETARQRRAQGGAPGPDLMALLDLVALATVADVAPLIGVNRAFVQTGLQVMARRERPGLTALCDAARIAQAPTTYHLGFVLGPRINAGGRIGQADLGARLLAAPSLERAAPVAQQLDVLNTARREIEAQVQAEALAQAEARGFDAPLVWAAGAGWHPGVVGIVASRLKEAANRPAIVLAVDQGVAKGSGRSVAGLDLGAAVHRLVQEGLIEKGGGHPMAAGLTISEARVAPAMERLAELIARTAPVATGTAELRLDGVLTPGAARIELAEQLDRAGPYGAGVPAPRFALPDVSVFHAVPVGAGHLKLSIGHGEGAKLDAIAFGAAEQPLGTALRQTGGRPVHIAGRLGVNLWRGRKTVQILVDDAALPAGGP